MTDLPDPPATRYQVDDLVVDVVLRRVERKGRALDLNALSFDLLRVLVTAAPATVTFDELAERAWGRSFVSQDAIAQRVKVLRKSLAEDGANPRYIEAVRTRGYRLIPPVKALPASAPPSRSRRVLGLAALGAALVVAIGIYVARVGLREAPADQAPVAGSIAVLPLEDLSTDPANAFFAAGIHDQIINRLSKIPELKVATRRAVLAHARSGSSLEDIGRALRVEAVVEGTVQYTGERVLVSVQLVSPETGLNRWSDTYDEALGDALSIQSEIAVDIAKALALELSPESVRRLAKVATRSPEAYLWSLRAFDAERRTDMPANLAFLDRAIEADAQFAEAYALKAHTQVFQVVNSSAGRTGSPKDRLEQEVSANIKRALELDPETGLAWIAQALVDQFNWRWDQADEAYARGLALEPNYVESLLAAGPFHSFTDRPESAVRLARHAVELDSTDARTHWTLGFVNSLAGRYDDALVSYRQAVRLVPTFANYHRSIAFAEIARGDRAAAEQELRVAESLIDGVSNPEIWLAGLIHGYGLLGLEGDAKRLHARFEAWALSNPDEAGDGDWIVASLGMRDAAAVQKWLRHAVEKIGNGQRDTGFYNLMSTRTNMLRDQILEQPELVELRQRIGVLAWR